MSWTPVQAKELEARCDRIEKAILELVERLSHDDYFWPRDAYDIGEILNPTEQEEE